MIATTLRGTHSRILTNASVIQSPTGFEASQADRQAVSFQVATAVVKTKDLKVPRELWNPEFDGKLRNGIGKSLTEQNSVIEEIQNDHLERCSKYSKVSRPFQKGA
ncbi:MAG TPA: hypothetical protein VMF91_10090 [Bryobacteraceae bacterium]|nr:hypothetical protein [Bryobacteraceae bacterium]